MRTNARVPAPAGDAEVDQHRQLVELYQIEREGMVRLAFLLTGSVSTAEDIVQEAFVKMHRAVASVERPGAYLRRTVVNLANSHHRRVGVEDRWRRRQAPPTTELAPELDETWRAVQELPDGQRAVLALRFYLDMKVEEIASVLELPAGTVKSRIHRGLAALTDEVTR